MPQAARPTTPHLPQSRRILPQALTGTYLFLPAVKVVRSQSTVTVAVISPSSLT